MTTLIRQPSSPDLHWQYLPFAQLGAARLYALLQLRSAVFVVEQACVFQDIDGLDAQAMHLLGVSNGQAGSITTGQEANSHGAEGQLLAYARCFPAGVAYPEASIGRVATHASARGSGAGHALMAQALAHMQAQWGAQPVRIGAQAHLQGFYAQHGFVATGAGYMEDGIAHVQMLRSA
jgi:ElaA protein